MAIDYTDERFAFPKSQVRALVKAAKDAKERNILQPTNAEHDAYTVKYWRQK